jgi:ATP:ADP antiporter, AAA family
VFDSAGDLTRGEAGLPRPGSSGEALKFAEIFSKLAVKGPMLVGIVVLTDEGRSVMRISGPIADDERKKALVAFLLFGLLMASYYLFKPVRGSLYLHYLGAKRLPYAYLASTGVSLLAMLAYNRVFVRLRAAALMPATTIFLAVTALMFWTAHLAGWISPQVLSVSFFLWVSLYGTLSSTLFWSVANDVFDTDIGRKIYGFIGAGGTVGALLGSWMTELIIRRSWVITEDLLPIGAGVLLLALWPMRYLLRGAASERRVPALGKKIRRRDGLRYLISDPYVRNMATLLACTTFVGALLSLQYNDVLEQALAGKEEKTAFFGQLFAMVNLLAIAVQIFVTTPLHRRHGPIPGLYVLPLVALCGVSLLVFKPVLTGIQVVWVLGLGLLYSLNQSSKELLYIPTSDDVKYGAKGYIDVFVFRLGDGTAALLMILLSGTLETGSVSVASLALSVIVVWLFMVNRMGKRYRQAVSQTGERGDEE